LSDPIHKSENPLKIFKEILLSKWDWIFGNPIYIIFFILFLFISSLGFWVPGNQFNNQSILIYCLPIMAEMISIGILLKFHSKSDISSDGTKSIFAIMCVLVIIWICLWYWAFDTEGNVSKLTWQAVIALIITLVWLLFFNSEKKIYEDKVKSSAPSLSDEPADKEKLN